MNQLTHDCEQFLTTYDPGYQSFIEFKTNPKKYLEYRDNISDACFQIRDTKGMVLRRILGEQVIGLPETSDDVLQVLYQDNIVTPVKRKTHKFKEYENPEEFNRNRDRIGYEFNQEFKNQMWVGSQALRTEVVKDNNSKHIRKTTILSLYVAQFDKKSESWVGMLTSNLDHSKALPAHRKIAPDMQVGEVYGAVPEHEQIILGADIMRPNLLTHDEQMEEHYLHIQRLKYYQDKLMRRPRISSNN